MTKESRFFPHSAGSSPSLQRRMEKWRWANIIHRQTRSSSALALAAVMPVGKRTAGSVVRSACVIMVTRSAMAARKASIQGLQFLSASGAPGSNRCKVSIKHLAAYLDELEHRFNNRRNEFLFRDTLAKLLTSENLKYAD